MVLKKHSVGESLKCLNIISQMKYFIAKFTPPYLWVGWYYTQNNFICQGKEKEKEMEIHFSWEH